MSLKSVTAMRHMTQHSPCRGATELTPLLPQERACASHRTVVMAVAKPWKRLDLSVPRRLRTNRWQVEDTT